MDFIEAHQFKHFLTSGARLLDVRSEIEFERAQIPGAVNIPILNSSERALVGTAYKHDGSAAAQALGHRLVCGPVKDLRISQWSTLCADKETVLFCARGGLRSEISQKWLKDAGHKVPRVRGGYQALRQFLLSVLDTAPGFSFVVISGRTGAGKTRLLRQLHAAGKPILDLEQAAVHRGSAFGELMESQPQQSSFENQLAISLLALSGNPFFISVEDESRGIGQVSIPPVLFSVLSAAPLVVLETGIAERVQNIIEDYIDSRMKLLHGLAVEDPLTSLETQLLSNVRRIQKRLGNERTRTIEGHIRESIRAQRLGANASSHAGWIAPLLKEYYDPFYDKHINANSERVFARGTFEELCSLLHERMPLKRDVSRQSDGRNIYHKSNGGI